MSAAGQTLANPTQTPWLPSHAQHVSTGTTRHDTLAPGARRHVSTVSNKSGAASNSTGDTAFPPGHRLRLSLLATVRAASATMFATNQEPASLAPPSPPAALATTSQGDSLGGRSPKLRGTLLATVAAAPIALTVRPCRGTARTVGRVLVHLAMLSTASGWVLPPKEEADAFSSHATMTTGGVGGARDRRRLVASSCDHGNCISCDDGCDGSCDFFGGCDDSCDEHCDGGCDGSCDTGCSACSTGETGAAEQVTCGPPAVARPPNTHLTPVHRASSSTSRVPAPQAPGSAAAMV